jgi:glutamine synthetase
VDLTDREQRRARAEGMLEGLSARGVEVVATTFVDNSGIARVKTVPLRRLPQLATWGAGFSTSFDRFRFDDWIAASGEGTEPVGDLRIVPDLDRVVPLVAQSGWAWTPGERYLQSGEPHPQCSRLLLTRLTEALAAHDITARCAVEIEWVISEGDGDEFRPGVVGSGYGMSRLIDASDYCRDVVTSLEREGIEVEQFHPEYADGQLEVAVSPESPVAAADTSVLVRSTIRAVGARHGMRTSFSPKVDVSGVGNGGHVHLSLWRDGHNLMAGGDRRCGLTAEGEGFAAGVLQRIPALLAIGCPSPVSYLRLVPSHWAGDYVCWGLENREAALRMVTGSAGSTPWAANLEVKCVDLLANPYLLFAGVLAAGLAGLEDRAELPDPVDVDPAALGEESLAERGIERLPTDLKTALDAFRTDDVLTRAFGPDLTASIIAVRESEIELFADSSDEQIADALRWVH